MKNNQESIRQQHLRDILGRNEQKRLCFSEFVYCVALSVKVFTVFFAKRLRFINS